MVALHTLTQLNARIHRAPRDSRTGTGWLRFLAGAALTVSTWIALIVSGGVLMFMERRTFPLSQFPPEAHIDALVLDLFVYLACIACAFVVPALIALIAQSAALGASVHQYRFATLRLIGLSSGDITRLTLIETLRQTVVGMIVGTVLSILTAPAWSLLSFQGLPISRWEMLLPWWGYVLVWAVVMVLALCAAFLGLSRVLITPLGVSRRQPPRAVRWWRVIVFFILFSGGLIYLKSVDMSQSGMTGWIILALVLLVLVSSISIISPFILQLIARLLTTLPGRTHFIATRRVATHAQETWRRVSTLSFLSLLLGYIAMSPPLKEEEFPKETGALTASVDISSGIVITFVIGVAITLMSTLLTQAIAVYEEAELTAALDFIGAPISLHRSVAFQQTCVPMLITGGFGYLLGMTLSGITYSPYVDAYPLAQVILPPIVLLLCILVISSTACAVEPLRRQVLRGHSRPND